MELTFPVNTLVLMVGPSGCGKSTLSNMISTLLKQHYGDSYNFPIVSSDEIRRQLLGIPDCHRYDDRMLYMSDRAFHLLREQVEAYMTFPVSLRTPLILVDTTGLSEDFRKEMMGLASRYSYNTVVLLFDYKDKEEYLIGMEDISSDEKKIIFGHIDRLRKKVLPKLKRSDYYDVIRIKHKDFSDLTITLSNILTLNQARLDSRTKYLVVGDVHGCLDQLIELMIKAGFDMQRDEHGWYIKYDASNPMGLVLLGDYLDKGEQILETIDFIFRNIAHIDLVLGNHEDWVVRCLKGEFKKDDKARIYFNTVDLLESLPPDKQMEYKTKLSLLHTMASPFLIHEHFVCTHAPTPVHHIGKLDKYSKSRQMKMRYPYREDYESLEEYTLAIEERLSFMQEQTITNWPFIFSGHIPTQAPISVGQQVMMDGGACTGGALVGAMVNGFRSVRYYTIGRTDGNLPKLFAATEDMDSLWYDLEPRDRAKIERALTTNPINFISGTMCPAPSTGDDLESLSEAINYYREKGVENLVIQPKHMGSRAQCYIFKDLSKCYAVSRNGYVINHVDLTSVFKDMHERVFTVYDSEDIELIILDGELMPWSLLGSGLIEHHFKPVEAGVGGELDFMEKNGFYHKWEQFNSSEDMSAFKEEQHRASKKELKSKYGDARAGWMYSALELGKYLLPYEVESKALAEYSRQLELHAGEGEAAYHPFSILKVVFTNGDEVVLPSSNKLCYDLFNPGGCLTISLSDPDAMHHINTFYMERVAEGMEGIVVKPLSPQLEGVAPYLKVRNLNYLRIVYGHAYNTEPTYSRLIRSKRIGGKLKASIKEWELGKAMLSIPYASIDRDNKQMRNLMVKFLGIETSTKSLDPRL